MGEGATIRIQIDEDRIEKALASKAGEKGLIRSARAVAEESVRRLVAQRRDSEEGDR